MGALAESSVGKVLCVDLDGTLIRTDLLHEASVILIKNKPWLLPIMILWAFKGPAHFKTQVFSRVEINLDNLPINQEVYDFIVEQKKSGANLVLASASPESIIKKIAKRLDIFSAVYGSTDTLNLKGSNKAQLLVKLFGAGNFDYIGDAKVDRAIWQHTNTAHVVGRQALLSNLPVNVQIGKVFTGTKLGVLGLFKALRVHQWSKNLLVFIPAFMAHTVLEPGVLYQAVVAFLALSFMASTIYLLNDLFDLDSDRQHPKKSKRALANGSMSIMQALVCIPILFSISLLLSYSLNYSFWALLLVYFATTSLYSFWLKQVVLIDIFTLAGLYTLRIIIGGVATHTLVSPWLLAFAMFAFLSLACAKRAAELHSLAKTDKLLVPGRGYQVNDLDQIARFGSASGYIAVLVLALYINSPVVTQYYTNPWYLWSLCPILLYWFSRVWFLTARGQLNEDPVLFSLTDKVSLFILVLCVTILLVSI